MIDSIACFFHSLILVRVVDREPISGTQCMRREYTLVKRPKQAKAPARQHLYIFHETLWLSEILDAFLSIINCTFKTLNCHNILVYFNTWRKLRLGPTNRPTRSVGEWAWIILHHYPQLWFCYKFLTDNYEYHIPSRSSFQGDTASQFLANSSIDSL